MNKHPASVPRIRPAWPDCNYYGDAPSPRIRQFCGPTIIQELESRPLGNGHPMSATITFTKDGKKYNVYKGPNRTKTPGKYLYHVYIYTQDDASAFQSKHGKAAVSREISPIKAKPTGNAASLPPCAYQPDLSRRVDLGANLGVLIDNCYLEADLPVIQEYNAGLNPSRSAAQCIRWALFEFGLMGDVDAAPFVLCNANSGFNPDDVKLLTDSILLKTVQAIRAGQKDLCIYLSPRSRQRAYPHCIWLQNKVLKASFLDFLKQQLKIQDQEALLDWLAHHFVMRDIFYYHSMQLNLRLWERSCRKVTGTCSLPHQEATFAEIRHAIKAGKPIVLGMGHPAWLQYIPELKAYARTFILKSYTALSPANILTYEDYAKWGKSAPKERSAHAWRLFTTLLQQQIATIDPPHSR